MLQHIVIFWLKADLPEADRAAFRAGLETLTRIEAAEAVTWGTPALTPERPVIDDSYNAMLVVTLKDIRAHDAYQDDPLHKAFLAEHKAKWERVVIYDAD